MKLILSNAYMPSGDRKNPFEPGKAILFQARGKVLLIFMPLRSGYMKANSDSLLNGLLSQYPSAFKSMVCFFEVAWRLWLF